VKKEQLEAAFLAKLERMKMRPEFFAVLKTVVTDMWAQRRELARDAQQRSRTRIEVLQERMGQLEEAHIFRRSIDQATFERHQDQLREQIALAELELHESKLEELDIEGILAFAEQLLENPARLWSEASPAQRQRIQVALFPEGVPYDGSEFGTAVTCFAFNDFPAFSEVRTGVASPTRLGKKDRVGGRLRRAA